MNCPYIVRICTKCKRVLVVCSINFGKQKGGKYGYKSKCKRCFSQYNKIYGKKHYNENKDYILNRNNIYYKANKEQISEQRKEYRKNNPHIQFNNHNKRRQLEESQGRGINKEQWLEMMNFFDWKCAYSGIQLTKDNRTIDHIVALDNGGKNEPWNCVPMYANYNYSKGNKDMESWYAQQEYFSEVNLQKIYKWCEYAYKKWFENS